MKNRITISMIFSMLLILSSCSGQDQSKETAIKAVEVPGHELLKKSEPHRYGGWYCPDNFGFTPVDIQKLNEVPAVADRLPTEQELRDNKSLINVDTEKYPDARALEMDLPRIASIYSEGKGMSELIIVIQAIIVSGDTVVGYRFPNGGNGSAWLSDVTFLTDDEVDAYGSQPFFYSTTVVNASKEEIWSALGETDYFKKLGVKFDKKGFFSSPWTSDSRAHLYLDDQKESATGFVGTHFGNVYLHIDYIRDDFHYSEKILMIENQEDNTTELFFANGPYPEDYEKQKSMWNKMIADVQKASEEK